MIKYGVVIIFYVLIVLIVYFNRKKFEFQAKFIALYRTQVGVKFMNLFAEWFRPIIKIMGYIGIFVGYIGMIFIFGYLLYGLYLLIYVPGAPAVLSPVIPGIPIPGSPIPIVPFWYGIIALFVVVAFHEFSHGIVSAAHKIKVKNSGIVFFGPLIGAFVEPDETNLKKKKWWTQQSVFAAGPFGNVILAILAILITSFLISPGLMSSVDPAGFYVRGVEDGMPAALAGLEPGVIYNNVNGIEVNDTVYLNTLLTEISPGDKVIISNNNLSHTIVSIEHPDIPGRAYLGVLWLSDNYVLKGDSYNLRYSFFYILREFFFWVYLLSLGIGLANLLPLGPVDGGRMFHQSLEKAVGKKKSLAFFSRFTVILLILILVLVVVPILRAVL